MPQSRNAPTRFYVDDKDGYGRRWPANAIQRFDPATELCDFPSDKRNAQIREMRAGRARPGAANPAMTAGGGEGLIAEQKSAAALQVLTRRRPCLWLHLGAVVLHQLLADEAGVIASGRSRRPP